MSALLKFPTVVPTPPAPRVRPEPRFQFERLNDTRRTGRHVGTFGVAVAAHAALAASILVLPLLGDDVSIQPYNLKAFLVSPATITPPPPPPPPPAPVSSAVRRAAVPSTPPPRSDVLRAPIEVPDVVAPEEPMPDLGIEGGMEGGVEGGVAGGVVGGVVGGLLPSAPVAPRLVRIGGNIKAPALAHRVDPVYPELARQARITGAITLVARVDSRGVVQDVRVVRGIPMLSDAAVEAVRQWRYRPLLLNGEPCEFELSVIVNFALAR